MFSVEVRDRIMIAHSLPDPFFGPAQHMHGATFVVDVAFFRSKLTRHNVVVDIGAALSVLSETLKPLAYKNLDELPQFAAQDFSDRAFGHFINKGISKTFTVRKISHLFIFVYKRVDS